MRVPILTITSLLAVLLATGTGTATAAPLITEFQDGLTADNGAWGVAPGPDGNVWFTEDKIDSVASVTPQGVVTEYPLGTAATCPKGIALGNDNKLWVAMSGNGGAIARVHPNGNVEEFTDSLLVGEPWDITAGPDGNMWFVVKTPAAIGRITPEGVITLFTEGLTPDSEPTGITAGPDGNLWFTESASPGRIGRITPAGEITEFTEGIAAGARPTDITAGPDGKLWFTDAGWPGGIGRIKPSGEITMYTQGFPAGMEPTGIAAGNDGALWFTMAADPGRIGRMKPDGSVSEHDDGLTAGQDPWLIASGPDGNVWFTENLDSGHIARVTVPAGVRGVEAHGVGKTVAQLKGWVLGNSQTTDYQFVYGPEGGEQTESPLYAAGRSSDPVKVEMKLDGLAPGTTYKFRLTATNDAGSSSASGRFTTQPEDVVLPDQAKFEVPGLAPDFSKSVVAQPAGEVRFKAPGGAWHKLDADDELPVGVTIDARNGSVTLTSEGDEADLQSGTFGGGKFAIRQPRRARGRVDLHLRGGNFSACPRKRTRRKRGVQAGASAARRVRRLWGRDRGGRFRTHGRHSHATVRGTRWVTVDRCNGTLTKVTEGSVLVRDLVERKSVLLRAGRSYVARKRR